MLRFLSIRRLAVIDSAEVEFGPGLNVLTGETGAGKSILVEAVGLLLGGRASAELVRTGEETAAVEAIFESGGEELIIRREVTSQGRSRAFVNGSLTTATALKDLTSRFVELHGQHEHQTLLDPSTHLSVIDDFGGLQSHREAVRAAMEVLRAKSEHLAKARAAVAERGARQELLSFQLGELEHAAPEPGEDERLMVQRQVLASSERIARLCEEGYAALYEDEQSALAVLSGVWRRVSDLAALDPRFRPFLEAKPGIKSQLEDLALFLRRYVDGIEVSPGALQRVEDRLAVLERLKRKYGPALSDVVARREAVVEELTALADSGDLVVRLEVEHEHARRTYVEAATRLGTARRTAAAAFSSAFVRELGELAMSGTRFEVRFDDRLEEDAWTEAGFDQAEFYVSPNPGEDLRPLARIASGGELSRMMLAIKTLAAVRAGWTEQSAGGEVGAGPIHTAPSVVFDEVDTGIGGRVADVIGQKLQALGSVFQVLCITHLPQIASHAHAHFHIAKQVEQGRTRTTVAKLDDAGRVDEIARMLGGAAVTDGIRASAQEMLARRDPHAGVGAKGETTAKGESESRPSRRGR